MPEVRARQSSTLTCRKPVFDFTGDGDDDGVENDTPHLSPFGIFRRLYNNPHPPSVSFFNHHQSVFQSINTSNQHSNNFFGFPIPKPQTKLNMLAQNILAIVAFATAAIAAPAVEERTEKTPAQKASQKCGNNTTLKCCDSVQKQMLGGLIPIQVGINCLAINREYYRRCPILSRSYQELTAHQSSPSSQSTRSARPRLLAAKAAPR